MTGSSGRVVATRAGRQLRQATAAAHAKAILFGEHAVVHGGPAIALPVHRLTLAATVTPRRGPVMIDSILHTGPLASVPAWLQAPVTALTETLAELKRPVEGFTLRVDGEIPAQRGLGSSAAVAAAISAAVARSCGVELDGESHFALIQAAERIAHGTPSGLDARSVVAGGPIWFERGAVRRLPVTFGGIFVIADTGITGGTREAVGDVLRLKEEDPARVAGLFAQIGAHTAAAAAELADDDRPALGERMSAVHAALQELTVSSPELDVLVDAARHAGALGAKLTGGGRGGCALALAATVEDADRVAAAMRAAGAVRTWTMRAGDTPA